MIAGAATIPSFQTTSDVLDEVVTAATGMKTEVVLLSKSYQENDRRQRDESKK